jgi:3-hydroxybutyryl-CoA dehydratase
MADTPPFSRGLYFEDFEVGRNFVTVGRTVAESDIFDFAGFSGDNNQVHTNAEFAKSTPFGQRVAHGLLGLSIASGLAWRTGIMEGTVIAFREVNNWKFVNPVFIGDTIHAKIVVAETKALPRIGGGSVVLTLDVKKQTGETVMKGNWTLLVMSKPK